MMSSGITYSTYEHLVALLVGKDLRAALSASTALFTDTGETLFNFSIPEIGMFIFRSFPVRHLYLHFKGMKL